MPFRYLHSQQFKLQKGFVLWNGIKEIPYNKGFISNFTYHLIIMVAFTNSYYILINIAEFPAEFIFPAMRFPFLEKFTGLKRNRLAFSEKSFTPSDFCNVKLLTFFDLQK